MHLIKSARATAAGLAFAALMTSAPATHAGFQVIDLDGVGANAPPTVYTLTFKNFGPSAFPVVPSTDGNAIIFVLPDGTVQRYQGSPMSGADANVIEIDGVATAYGLDDNGFILDCAALFDEHGVLVLYLDGSWSSFFGERIFDAGRLWGCELTP